MSVVQAIVGHGSPEMTNHYTHIGEETAIKAAEVITLAEPEESKKVVPPWIQELAAGMTAENWEEIKAVLVRGES